MALIKSPPSTQELDQKVIDALFKQTSLINDINAHYPYWTKAKYLGKRHGLDADVLWRALKFRRMANGETINFRDGFYFNTPPSLQRDLHELDMHCGGSLQSTIATIPKNMQERFIISSLLTEAYSSSLIEGAVSTRDRAKELIRQGQKPITKSERMILNNYLAMEFIREHKNQVLTTELLLELHALLSKDALDQGEPGRYRTSREMIGVFDDRDGESIHTPPPAHELEQRMEELIRFFNYKEVDTKMPVPFAGSEAAFVHPILRATTVHFMIGYIHPFADGNGRIARALFYWHMLSNEYWLAAYLSISQVILDSRESYYRSFMQVELDDNDLTYFLLYHTKALMQSFERLKEYLHRKLNLQRIDLADEAIRLSITPRQASLLVAIRKSPTVWTVAQAETYLGVSHATARGDLSALTDKGHLKQFNLDKKTQAWRLV